jgi:hypothetical protein
VTAFVEVSFLLLAATTVVRRRVTKKFANCILIDSKYYETKMVEGIRD